jgi:hypothetical protein
LLSRIKSRAPRIRAHLVDYVVPIGRRALEVAITEAVSQKELHPRLSEWKPELSRIADASQDVVAALERLFKAINPDGKDAEHFAPFIRRLRVGGVASKAEYRDVADSALRDARLLVEAKQISGKLHADTLTRRDALLALYPPSLKDHQQRAFVRILAELWVFLTGEMPGKNRDPSKNPFLRVVEAAWSGAQRIAVRHLVRRSTRLFRRLNLSLRGSSRSGLHGDDLKGRLPSRPYPSQKPTEASCREMSATWSVNDVFSRISTGS